MSSRLSRGIKAYLLSGRKVKPTNLRLCEMNLEVDPIRNVEYDVQHEYALMLKLGMRTYLNNKEPAAIEHALETVRCGVVEEIYGDIRRLLIELRVEMLYSSNSYSFQGSKVSDLLQKLFEETQA